MFKRLSFFIVLLAAFTFFAPQDVYAQGFSTLKAAGQGLSSSDAEEEDQDVVKGKGGKVKKDIDERYSGSSATRRRNVAGMKDPIHIGVFETYLVTKRYNARLTVFGEARKFLLGHRACLKIRKIRDEINTYLFKNPPEVDKKGRVQNTKEISEGVRKAVKKALKTKLEYFTSYYVVSGRYGPHKVPKDLEGATISDCAGVKNKKKAMDKAKK